MDKFHPLPPLSQALQAIDRVFGLDKILKRGCEATIQSYYASSEVGYRWVHSKEGCMHLALSSGPVFQDEDFRTHAAFVADLIHETGAKRVLELGCGLGFNVLELARQCPSTETVGLDLLDRHVRKARALVNGNQNVSVVEASYDRIPRELGTFDIIFAIEALCHAPDRLAVATAISEALKPGGFLVVFDAVRSSRFGELSEDMQLAVRLYEATTVVQDGFGTAEQWTDAYGRAGLYTQRRQDMSRSTIPGLRRLYRHGARYFSDSAIRAVTAPLPWALKANAVGALLGPYLIEGPFEGGHQSAVPRLNYELRVCTVAAGRQVGHG